MSFEIILKGMIMSAVSFGLGFCMTIDGVARIISLGLARPEISFLYAKLMCRYLDNELTD